MYLLNSGKNTSTFRDFSIIILLVFIGFPDSIIIMCACDRLHYCVLIVATYGNCLLAFSIGYYPYTLEKLCM